MATISNLAISSHRNNKCIKHHRSDTIEFTSAKRKIQRGCCLKHSENGSISFSGIDLQTGQLLYITEWMIKYSQLEAKCVTKNCHQLEHSATTSCKDHGVDEVIENIENLMKNLSQLRHTNLVNYECVQCVKESDGIFVCLAQDFIHGNSVANLSTSSLVWCEQSASVVAKSVVDALVYLQQNHIAHGLLCDGTVFIDNFTVPRITDFGLVPYLRDLIGAQTFIINDLEALAALLESLLPIPSTPAMQDFMEKCTAEGNFLAVDLLDHPFLQSAFQSDPILNDEEEITKLVVLTAECSEISQPVTNNASHFKNNYTILEDLGEGGFGDVFKVKNNLDNSEYAIKKILLRAKSHKNYADITREVKVIARLNHENIVRYYTSWKEPASLSEDELKSKLDSDDYSMLSFHDSVEFVNASNTQINDADIDAEEDPEFDVTMSEIMYIQMEYCDGSTLRTKINDKLYVDVERLWRLFREIVEGLSHIHQQDMIHRDLKPENIFIGSRDQIKIGDFGLSTILGPNSRELSKLKTSLEAGETLTQNIGTAPYRAPEISGNKRYDTKIDLYSLGIILFEMSCAPFSTGMERIHVLNDLRSIHIKIPQNLQNDPKYQGNVKVIRWLLQHNPSDRPTTEELLDSHHLPRPTKEFHKLVHDTISQPQSNHYRNLIARCLEQESDAVLDLTYNHVPEHQNTVEYIKSRVVNLFRKHGAIEVDAPLLMPCSENYIINKNAVRLMTRSGTNVFLPHDLRLPFARHIAVNGINSMRRYSIERVYREDKVFNFHPMELYECAFDIVTPNPGTLLIDAELIVIAYNITKEMPMLQQKNISFRINHTALLRAVLLSYDVPASKFDEVARNLHAYLDGKSAKPKLVQFLIETVPDRTTVTTLFNVLTTEYLLADAKKKIPNIFKAYSAAGYLAKEAMRDIESVLQLAQWLGVNCEIRLLPGLPGGYESTKSSGIVWQMLVEEKFKRKQRRYLLAIGERYDNFVSNLQVVAFIKDVQMKQTKISAAGFSFSLENLMYAYATTSETISANLGWAPIQVCVCVVGVQPPLKVISDILKSLWSAGICSGFVEGDTSEHTRDMAKKLGARHLVELNQHGGLKLRTFISPNLLQDRQITSAELINTIQRMMEPNEQNFHIINNNLKQQVYNLKKSLSQKKIQQKRLTRIKKNLV